MDIEIELLQDQIRVLFKPPRKQGTLEKNASPSSQPNIIVRSRDPRPYPVVEMTHLEETGRCNELK